MSGLPFYRQVKNDLRDQIRSGQLAAGTALPSIRELAAQLLVSVITIKKAYDDLEAEGFIVSHQGKGTFVAELQGFSHQALLSELSAEIKQIVYRAKAMGISKAAVESSIQSALEGYEESQ